MTTRGDFRDNSLRSVMSDIVHFPEATLNQWIDEGIRDYSRHFPWIVRVDLEVTVAGERQYDLSLVGAKPSFYGVTRVEYPTGQDPPRYLLRRPETSASFLGNPVYDIRQEEKLVIGEQPAAGEFIRVWYATTHMLPAADGSELSIPDKHLEALKLFAIWQAAVRLEVDEMGDPDTLNVLLGTFGLNAYRAEQAYRAKIREYLEAAGQGGYAGPWVMDGYDRIY